MKVFKERLNRMLINVNRLHRPCFFTLLLSALPGAALFAHGGLASFSKGSSSDFMVKQPSHKLNLDFKESVYGVNDPAVQKILDNLDVEQTESEASDPLKYVLDEMPYDPRQMGEKGYYWVVVTETESFLCSGGQASGVKAGEFDSVTRFGKQLGSEFQKLYSNAEKRPDFYAVTSDVAISNRVQTGVAGGLTEVEKCIKHYLELSGKQTSYQQGTSGGQNSGGSSTSNAGGGSNTGGGTMIAFQSSGNPSSFSGGSGSPGGEDPNRWNPPRGLSSHYVDMEDDLAMEEAIRAVDRIQELGRHAALGVMAAGYFWPVEYIPDGLYRQLRDHPFRVIGCTGAACALAMAGWQAATGRINPATLAQRGVGSLIPRFGMLGITLFPGLSYLIRLLPTSAQRPAVAGILGVMFSWQMAENVSRDANNQERMSVFRYFLPYSWYRTFRQMTGRK